MQLDLNQLNNSSFALLVWYIQDGKEDEAKVYRRIASWNQETKCVEVRENASGELLITLKDEQLERIQIVTPDFKNMLLDCDYGISLTMRDIPDDKTNDYDATGLNW